MSEKLKEVFEWSREQTSESHSFVLKDYYWTDPVKKTLFRLTNANRALLGIQGLQGTGKSAALEALAETLSKNERVLKYKWKRDWKKEFFDDMRFGDDYWRSLWVRVLHEEGLIEEQFKMSHLIIMDYLKSWKAADDKQPSPPELPDIVTNPDWLNQAPKSEKCEWRERLDKIADLDKLEALLGSKVCEEVKEFLTENFFDAMQIILIDMPDYNKTNLQLMNKDIDELQHKWHEFMESRRRTSFVISVQKEIVMRKPHFFFGKIQWVNLKPLTQDELLEAYRQKWGTLRPFTEEALRLIAKLCRGVFRRFLSYINLTIEGFQMLAKSGLISVEDVERAISFEVLLGDLELELADIFSNAQQRIQAVKVLDFLRKNELSQKEIAEQLDVSEATCSKLVGKLCLYNYVTRKRGEGKG